MIKGIGVDAVSIDRMKNSLIIDGFKESVFTAREINNEHGDASEYYATRFACKEAVFKAVSHMFKLDWRTVETLNRDDGSPYITSTIEMQEAGIYHIHISITTENGIAIAYCIVE